MNRNLAKSEQSISEVLEELNASQNRKKADSEASKIYKATFEVATKRLENHVSSLEAEVERSKESYVTCSLSSSTCSLLRSGTRASISLQVRD